MTVKSEFDLQEIIDLSNQIIEIIKLEIFFYHEANYEKIGELTRSRLPLSHELEKKLIILNRLKKNGISIEKDPEQLEQIRKNVLQLNELKEESTQFAKAALQSNLRVISKMKDIIISEMNRNSGYNSLAKFGTKRYVEQNMPALTKITTT